VISLGQKLKNCYFLAQIKRSPFAPHEIIAQKFGPFYIFNLSRTKAAAAVSSPLLCAGMATNPHLALSKALSEYVERLAFWEGGKNNQPLCQTSHSEGFAALPYLWNYQRTLQQVRSISYGESIERFCWPQFWHDTRVGFRRRRLSSRNRLYLSLCREITEVEHVFPFIAGKYILCISLGRIGKSGVVLGASCHPQLEHAIFGSLTELIRHYFALRNIANGGQVLSNYQRRLAYLSQSGYPLYKKRLSSRGTQKIRLPSLYLDGCVDHYFKKSYLVYRSRFVGQPIFVDKNEKNGYI
jgi:hypothetical protein